jgi:hypothetical protein
MYQERNLSRHYIFRWVWLLLGGIIGIHFPDLDNRFQWLIPSWILLHRSILTHGLIISSLLFLFVRNRRSTMPSLRLFVIGLSLAFAAHLCFDFFPRSWIGFALIHIPLYGRTNALFSQAWIILSVVICLYLAFLLVRNIVELTLSVGNLVIAFSVSAFENEGATLLALMLLALATVLVVMAVRQVHKAEAHRV